MISNRTIDRNPEYSQLEITVHKNPVGNIFGNIDTIFIVAVYFSLLIQYIAVAVKKYTDGRPTLAGFIFDTLGTYDVAWISFGIASCFTVVLMLSVKPKTKPA